ncbi:hypothetical protein WJX79_006248 [Trebouxia sp. C0005]
MVTPMVCSKVFSRVGLLGNPSDGFFGKTIAVSCANFWAEVRLKPADIISFKPHAQHDLLQYTSLEHLTQQIAQQGYYGGIRLLMAMCKRFAMYCQEHGIELQSKNFSLEYDTNIPRQAGLSGSSAIACAALNCLMQYHDIQDRIPLTERPQLILGAEAELGITAGLQDRVIQVYGGMMFMDFSPDTGHNRFERLPVAQLPPLWLVYSNSPSDSGAVHSPVKSRWLTDLSVRREMAQIAALAEQGRAALAEGDMASLADLMDRNFDLRRSIFGDNALGATNLHMIRLARSVGAAAKFTGSGGAIVVFCHQGTSQVQKLQDLCQKEGYVMVKVIVTLIRKVF